MRPLSEIISRSPPGAVIGWGKVLIWQADHRGQTRANVGARRVLAGDISQRMSTGRCNMVGAGLAVD